MQEAHHVDVPKFKINPNFDPAANIVLYEGDNQELLASVPDGSIKLIVTSPPYNVGKSYETKVAIEKYLEAQKTTITQLYKVLADNGSICWQVGNYVEDKEIFPLDIFYYEIFKDLGMKLRNRIIWHFGHGLHAKTRFSGRYETLLWFTKGDNYIFNLDDVRVPSKYPGKLHFKGEKKGQPSGNPKGKNPSDFWQILLDDWEQATWDIPNCKSNHPEKTIHPAQFPIELAERCVLALSDKNDWVYDPYSGVGSTMIAALKHDRRAAGSEQLAEYVQITKQRIEKLYAGTLPMRPLGQAVWQPTGTEKVARIPDAWKQSVLIGSED